MRLDDAQALVASWHRATFGEHIPTTWLGLKLAEEAGEICRELLRGDGEPIREGRPTTPQVAAEAADALIVLLALADRAGFDLGTAFAERLEIITARTYSPNGGARP